MTDELRRDVGAWLGYLREIGVRELRPGPGDGAVTPSSPPREAAVAPERPAARASAAPAPESNPAEARSGELFGIGASTRQAGHDGARELVTIREELGDCTRCVLHEGRTNIVFGVGNPDADLMFIGEGPGRDEDEQGEPFVGRAGQKLNDMIRAIGLEREQVYIANIVKCRPPDNRDPKPEEIATCSPFLFRQIEAIRPKVIVTLGSPATKTLLATKAGITKLRGQWHSFRGVPVMPTFHPAYLLRSYTEENRRMVWDDLRAARARVDTES